MLTAAGKKKYPPLSLETACCCSGRLRSLTKRFEAVRGEVTRSNGCLVDWFVAMILQFGGTYKVSDWVKTGHTALMRDEERRVYL